MKLQGLKINKPSDIKSVYMSGKKFKVINGFVIHNEPITYLV